MKNYKRTETGIILALVLWVLFFLSVTALTVGLKNRMNIRLRSIRNEEFRMFCLAKEGLNRAIVELANDDASFDSFNDGWNKDFSLQSQEWLLSYKVIDEDRFLNINTAGTGLLNNIRLLFPQIRQEEIDELIKKRPFNLSGEIPAAAGIDDKVFNPDLAVGRAGLKDLITVFSDGKININTACEELFTLIPSLTQASIDAILTRRKSSAFENNDTLSQELSLLGLTPEQVSSVVKYFKVNSSCFRVRAHASSRRKQVSKDLEAILEREKNGFLILLFKES